MGWTRPDKPAIPTVYYTFQAKDDDSDRLVTYRVEDITEDRYEDMIQHYVENYLDDEPWCQAKKLSDDEIALEEMIAFWRWTLEQRMSIVCYKEGSNEIVGANLLHVRTPETQTWEIKSAKVNDIIVATEYMTDTFDVFKEYDVKEYLTAYGLAINRRYRGRGIATEMLRARVPMCKAFGIKLTSTTFTAEGSQHAAAKAGYVTDLEITHEDFAKLGPQYAFPGIRTKSVKLMNLRIE